MNCIYRLPMYYLYSLLTLCSIASCKKFVNIPAPISSTNSANVYANDATAIASITGIYTLISSRAVYNSLSLLPALSADELTLFSGSTDATYNAYYQNKLTGVTAGTYDIWSTMYPIIFYTNSAIAGLSNQNNVSQIVKQQLLGEAKFLRAFCYFYLTNLYGDVPLVISTDYTVNSTLSKTPKANIYRQIISDLQDAKNLLSTTYLDGSLTKQVSERVRPTSWAAASLLSRTYLFMGIYDSAEMQANTVINNTSLYRLSRIDSVFLKNNSEAVWQLQPVQLGQNTPDAILFVLPASGPNVSNQFYLNGFLLNSFEPGDARRTNWVDSVIAGGGVYYYPYKYKVNLSNQPVSEYETIFRLGEQYLIRAEARIELANFSGAQADLNLIRKRAGLLPVSDITQTGLLSLIMHERQVELFTECGHRWLDLKRTGSVNMVMGDPGGVCATKGGIWNSNQQLYPIPTSELITDPNLVQNSGY